MLLGCVADPTAICPTSAAGNLVSQEHIEYTEYDKTQIKRILFGPVTGREYRYIGLEKTSPVTIKRCLFATQDQH